MIIIIIIAIIIIAFLLAGTAKHAAQAGKDSSFSLDLVDIRKKQIGCVRCRLETLGEQIGLRKKLTLGGTAAVHLLDNLAEAHPPVLLGRLVGGNGHDECDQTILSGARDRRVVHKRLAKGNSLSHIGLVVPGQEEVVRHVGVSGKVVLVDSGSVGVDIVGLDHSLCSEDFGTLVVSVGRLTADINHGLDTVGVTDKATGRVELFGSTKLLDALVNVARSNGQNVNGVLTGQETGHVQIVDGHVGKDSSTALDVLKGWGRGVTRAKLDLCVLLLLLLQMDKEDTRQRTNTRDGAIHGLSHGQTTWTTALS